MLTKIKSSVQDLFGSKDRSKFENLWSKAVNKKANWAKGYQDSWSAPHRLTMTEELSQLAPETLLELGCNAGPNIISIMKNMKNPPKKIHGIDINKNALVLGNEFFNKEGWNSVTTEYGILPEALQQIPDRSFDTVMAIAVLMHLAPGSFEATVKEAQRIAKKSILFIDIHPFQNFFDKPQALLPSEKYKERWQHNWWKYLDRNQWSMKISELTPESSMANVGDINAVIVATRK